ncbi:MAG: TonB-dependent receptor [Candidatus Dadabacteria bacterium]|nr:MAG: TonB-dependent receptor [Candidatus Dadabacteria bacterium]
MAMSHGKLRLHDWGFSMRKLALLATLILMPLAAQAQDEEFSDFSALDLEALLNTEVDTGGGFGKQSLSEVPAVVEVWTREDLQRLGVRTLAELLEHLTGVYRSYHNLAPFIFNEARLRGGASARRISLMIDNHSVLDEFDEAYNILSIPIDSIERVEFLRGPAAVLYGSSAMAGVIRVITRDPDGNAYGGSAAANLLDPPNGLDGTAAAAVRLDGGWRVRTDVQGGLTNDRDVFLDGDDFGIRGSFPRQSTWVSLLSTARNDNWYARVQYHYLRSFMQGFQAALSNANKPSTLQMAGAEMGYSGGEGPWRWSGHAALDYRKRELDFGRFPPTAPLPGFKTIEENRTILRYNGYLIEAQGDSGYQADRWQAKVGIQSRSHYVTDFDLRFKQSGGYNPLIPLETVRGLIEDFNVFIQGGVDLHEKLSLLGGLRLNVYKTRTWDFQIFNSDQASPDPTFSPMGRGALIWRAHDRLTVKALYGRAFRLPSILELFSAVATVITPNPYLDPELQDSYELVFDSRPTDTLTVRLNGFVNAIQDSIETRVTSPTATEAQFVNLEPDVLWTWGADLGVTWLPVTMLRVDLSATFHEGRWDRGSGLKNGEYLRTMPRVLAKGAAMLKLFEDDMPLWMTPSVIYRGRYGDGDAATWLHANIRWQPVEHWTLLLTGRNLTGTRAFTTVRDDVAISGYEEDSREVRIGVEATF